MQSCKLYGTVYDVHGFVYLRNRGHFKMPIWCFNRGSIFVNFLKAYYVCYVSLLLESIDLLHYVYENDKVVPNVSSIRAL